MQVLSTVPAMFSYERRGDDLARFLNDHLAGICRDHPQRFAGLGTLPLQSPELAVRELERCVRELGLLGVQIGSHVNEWNLSEPALFPVFARAAELGAAVFVHPWDMMSQEKMAACSNGCLRSASPSPTAEAPFPAPWGASSRVFAAGRIWSPSTIPIRPPGT